jgi:hypothetical protein
MRHESSIDHRADIALVVGVEALELADDDIDHVENLEVELPEVCVELGKVDPPGSLRKEGESWRQDLHVDSVLDMERGVPPGEVDEASADVGRQLDGLEDIAVLCSALVVDLQHQSRRADDG